MENNPKSFKSGNLKYISRIEQDTPIRTKYYVGSNFIIELTAIYFDKQSSTNMISKWVKAGYLPHRMSSYISVKTYYTDETGICTGKYNPQYNKEHKLNFEYVLEVTEENTIKLLRECIRRWRGTQFKQQGK